MDSFNQVLQGKATLLVPKMRKFNYYRFKLFNTYVNVVKLLETMKNSTNN